MRAALAILTGVCLVAGCGLTPGLRSLQTQSTGKVKAKDVLYSGSNTNADELYSWLGQYTRGDNTVKFHPQSNFYLTSEASGAIAVDPTYYYPDDQSISEFEVMKLVLNGTLEIDNTDPDNAADKAHGFWLTTSAPAPTHDNHLFQELLDQRKYYAGSPQDGQPYWQHQAKIMQIDKKLMLVATADDTSTLQANSTATCSELVTMRGYYDDPNNPPADGQPATYHYQQLTAVLNAMYSASLPQNDYPGDLNELLELRSYVDANANGMLTGSDRNAWIQKVNGEIDTLEGINDARRAGQAKK